MITSKQFLCIFNIIKILKITIWIVYIMNIYTVKNISYLC